jgi:hypothetical protein
MDMSHVPIYLLQGHAGGHYATGDLLENLAFTKWPNNEGNFAYGNSERITVEQLHGTLQTILLANLQPADRKIAQLKVKRYKSIHGQEFTSPLPKSSKPSFPGMRWIAFFLIATLALQVFAHDHQKKWLQPIGFASLFVGIIWACKTESAISPSNPSTSPATPSKTSISFLDSAFAPYKNN